MLLSLHAKSTLGLVKGTATGKCYLKEHDDYCQLYEVEGSGLRAICVSDFDDKHVQIELPMDIGAPRPWEHLYGHQGADFGGEMNSHDSSEEDFSDTDIGDEKQKDFLNEARR
eukprot:11913532-Heterocapsa_arctica.AAC.1